MKQRYIIVIAMFFVAVLFSNCTKDEMFIKEEGPGSSDITLKINEVFSNSETEPDWIEIYNTGDVDIDMSGLGAYDKVDAKFTWPTGTIIPKKAYIVLICDKDMATDDPENVANFKLSSKGESVSLVDKDGKIIDEVDFPALDLGVSYARIPDGADTWEVSNPTKGSENSNENTAPEITADTIKDVNDYYRFTYKITAVDASGLLDVKLYYKTSDATSFVSMAPIGGGEYTFTFPLFEEGEMVEYYVVATDVTNLKTYFPETAPSENLSFTVQHIIFDDIIEAEVNYTEGPLSKVVFPTNPTPSESIIKLTYDSTGYGVINDARIYFDLGDEPIYVKKNKVKASDQGSFTQMGAEINIANIDDYDGTGNTSVTGTKVTFYVRIETDGAEYYYGNDGSMYIDVLDINGDSVDPTETDGFKADATLWNSYTVQMGHL